MTEFGYALSSEEHRLPDSSRTPSEEHGFEFAMISDHFHPWTGSQGNSPFVVERDRRDRERDGSDPPRHRRHLPDDPQEQVGFRHVYLHQIGSDQHGFFRFWQDELGPKL